MAESHKVLHSNSDLQIVAKKAEMQSSQTSTVMQIDEEKENAELLKLYRRLLRKAKPRLKEGDAKLIKKAFKFAADAHKDMRRKSGEPYIFHPMSVALIVAEEIGLGTTSIIAAFLHDVVEDTEYTLEDIEERFGSTVAEIIDGLTKMSATTQLTTSIQAENFRKMLLTISKDIRVVLIKIADRLHNMRTLNSMPRDKRLKIRSETAYIYAPLAHRLGLYSIKSELEDLGLKYSDPEAYNQIQANVDQSKSERDRFFKMFVKPIKSSLKGHDYNFEIKMRAKSNYSIYRKMQKQDIPFEQVYDYYAIRIILKGDIPLDKEKAACWEVYSIVTDHYTPNTNRLRDWISVPRDNGYESLHITVMGPNGQWVEVQIRTERMDEIAEKGYAAHWRYKETPGSKSQKKKKQRPGLEHWLAKVRELLENNNLNAFEFLDDFRANLYQDEVYAFTPKGDLKKFPTGASVLDFAFEIHTEVGARCLGAKVNGKLVPLNYQLQNGDQVEILTSNQPKANEGWLKYVVTSRARSKIKDYLKEDVKRLAAMGKEIVLRKLKQMKLPYNDKNITKLSHFFNYKTETEFYYHVGNGDIDHTEIKKFKDLLSQETQSKKWRPETAKEFKQEVKKIRKSKTDDELVIGENMDDLEYGIAKCCNPIPGDNIFGFITVNSGIKIHRTSCPNAVSLLANYGHRVIKARWAGNSEEEFEADLIIEGTDRIGLVNDITRIISNQMKVNIKSINIGANTGIFRGQIALSVHDSDELHDLIHNLENIDGVIKVIRMEEKV